MKKFLAVSMMCAVSVFILVACEREQSVQAGGEDRPEMYQPKPAPVTPGVTPGETGTGTVAWTEARGELIRIDQGNKTIVIRTVNGLEQTLKFNDQTMVRVETTTGARPGTNTNMTTRNLTGKEGSEVMVQWTDDAGGKMLTSVTIMAPETPGDTR